MRQQPSLLGGWGQVVMGTTGLEAGSPKPAQRACGIADAVRGHAAYPAFRNRGDGRSEKGAFPRVGGKSLHDTSATAAA